MNSLLSAKNTKEAYRGLDNGQPFSLGQEQQFVTKTRAESEIDFSLNSSKNRATNSPVISRTDRISRKGKN